MVYVGRLLELSGTLSKSVSSAEKMTTSCSENGEFDLTSKHFNILLKVLFLFSIFNMKKLFSIVSPPTFHLTLRSLLRRKDR